MGIRLTRTWVWPDNEGATNTPGIQNRIPAHMVIGPAEESRPASPPHFTSSPNRAVGNTYFRLKSQASNKRVRQESLT